MFNLQDLIDQKVPKVRIVNWPEEFYVDVEEYEAGESTVCYYYGPMADQTGAVEFPIDTMKQHAARWEAYVAPESETSD